MERARPVAPDERVVFWDVLRGFAVLGILLANMPFMSLAASLADMSQRDSGATLADSLARWAVFFVADTKFVTIFSLLFGAGLGFMSERARQRGQPLAALYSRRLLVLLLFGVAHGLLLWFGDILTSYALLGFAALLFRKRTPRTLVRWAVPLLVVGLLLWGGLMAFDPDDWVDRRKGPDGTLLSVEATLAARTAELRDVFSSGDFARMLPERAKIYAQSQMIVLLLFGTRTLALFLLGMALVKVGWFTRPEEQHARFRRWAILGLSIGVPLHAIAALGQAEFHDSAAWRVTSTATLYCGGLAQAFAYTGIVALWSLSERLTGLRARLAAVGRMAFTNYIAHSAITAVIFNYAGLFDRLSRAAGLGLVVAIFAAQLAWSPWWLARFHMGPLEWVWRALTYRTRTPFRRTVAAAASP